MFNQKMVKLGTQRSVIREIFEYGNMRAKEIGKDNVLDFSIGNPNVPAPKEVQDAIRDLIDNHNPAEYHSYTSNPGAEETRNAIANNLNKRFNTSYSAKNIFVTCGAAASLNITLQSLLSSSDDEVIAIAPFFAEYRFFVEAHGGKFVLVDADLENFQIDFPSLEKAINKNTKAIIINSPNNPAGTVYSEETIKKLANLLNEKSEEYSSPIFIISDEPYRELVYSDIKVPFVPNYYKNTIVNYSWSKSLSLPGERIGYILIPDSIENGAELMAACGGSARILGYVCAPSMFQKVIAKVIDVVPDVSYYEKNRNLLFSHLKEYGYKMANPDGAFYAFIEAPNKDAKSFCEMLKKHDVLLVPGDGFGVPSYMRLSYCVATEKIERALPIFKKVMEEYKKSLE